MRLADLMETTVATVSPEVTAEDAWERMRQRRIHHLVVVDGSRVIGLLSDRDLGSIGGGYSVRQNRAVGDLMTRHVVTARPTTTIREAANLMRGRSIGCLPVVQKERLVGIVTVSDLLMLIGRGAERGIAPGRRWTLKSRRSRSHGVSHRRGVPGH